MTDNGNAGLAKPLNSSFVAVDWGTSSFRLWSVTSGGDVIDSVTGPYGMASLQPAEYEKVLERSLVKLDVPETADVVICGMAGAAQGWHEAPYRHVSESLFSLGHDAVRVPELKRNVFILPGIKQSHPSNVMRGEETQLLGVITTHPGFNGIVCMPGTHTKWVRLNNGQIERFTTCMTGELFALLSEHSVLKHSVKTQGWHQETFDSAVRDAISAPCGLAESLFGVRASSLLDGQSFEESRARLSGMLVGFELAAMRSYWESGPVMLVGETMLCQRYSDAMLQQQVQAQGLDSEHVTLGGLINAYKQLEGFHYGA